jgi:hypothetical protein
MRITSGLTLLSVASLGAGTPAARATTAPPEPGLARDLAEASRRTVWFAHQSVGANVVEGLAELAARTGAPLRLAEGPPGAASAPGTWAHAFVGENGAPRSKLDAFVRSLDEAGRDPDVALLKLCYVDFHQGTDPAALLEAYRTALASLRARHPRTTFVHVTVPLTAPDPWPRALAKRLLGREGSAARNARRERYNALLRDAYAGREPLFDLAALESRCPDGIPATEPWRGLEVPALCPAYTDDGGHLNAAGRERAARALLTIVAAVPAPGLPAPTEARGWTR